MGSTFVCRACSLAAGVRQRPVADLSRCPPLTSISRSSSRIRMLATSSDCIRPLPGLTRSAFPPSILHSRAKSTTPASKPQIPDSPKTKPAGPPRTRGAPQGLTEAEMKKEIAASSGVQKDLLKSLNERGGKVTPTLMQRFGLFLYKAAPETLEVYPASGGCRVLINQCIAQTHYTIPAVLERNEDPPKNERGEHIGEAATPMAKWWFEMTGLPLTFTNWGQITFLHLYLVYIRIRMFEPAKCRTWQQTIIDTFFFAAEDRMLFMHKITSDAQRQRYLKDMDERWRGSLVAYDEGLMRGDAYLAAAIWRNIWHSKEDVDAEKLAMVVAWMRKMIQRMEATTEDNIVTGQLEWVHPQSMMPEVREPSELMQKVELDFAKEAGKPVSTQPNAKPAKASR